MKYILTTLLVIISINYVNATSSYSCDYILNVFNNYKSYNSELYFPTCDCNNENDVTIKNDEWINIYSCNRNWTNDCRDKWTWWFSTVIPKDEWFKCAFKFEIEDCESLWWKLYPNTLECLCYNESEHDTYNCYNNSKQSIVSTGSSSLKINLEKLNNKNESNTLEIKTNNLLNISYNDLITSANYLAKFWVIVDQSSNTEWYRFNDNITRWEMAKIVSILWEVNKLIDTTNINYTCNNLYKDLNSSDWECKYAENWLNKWFFSKNEKFRPKDNITKIEALKMIMNSRSIQKWNNNDWKQAYIEWALKSWIIDSSFSDYDSYASRWWIFYVSYNAIGWNKNSTEEEDDNSSLLDDLLWN